MFVAGMFGAGMGCTQELDPEVIEFGEPIDARQFCGVQSGLARACRPVPPMQPDMGGTAGSSGSEADPDVPADVDPIDTEPVDDDPADPDPVQEDPSEPIDVDDPGGDDVPADDPPADDPVHDDPVHDDPPTDDPADDSGSDPQPPPANAYPLYPYDLSGLGSAAPEAPRLPSTTRQVVATSVQQLQSEAQAGKVQITVGFNTTNTVSLRGDDIDLVIPAGRYIGNLNIGHGYSNTPVRRLRVRGPGMVGGVQISGGSHDVYFEGVLINPAPFNQHYGILVNSHANRIAFIRSIVRAGHPGVNDNGAAFTGRDFQNLMIAGCHFAGSQWAGGDDWAFRANAATKILIVDSYLYSGGGRATARFNGRVQDFTIDRSTLVNLGVPFSFMEEPGTTPMDSDRIYFKNSDVYVDNRRGTNLIGHAIGAKDGSSNVSRFWQLRNLTITTHSGIRHDAAWLNQLASRADPGEVRDYGANTHTYRAVGDVAAMVPAFPRIDSPVVGPVRSASGSSDPYDLPTRL